MSKKIFDFSGYATKVDLKCSDGRVIRKDAFKHNDGQTVPLVWQHVHNDPTNVLGHAILENREDGVYTYCTFNDTETGKHAKALVEHGDITSLSIHANQLKQKGDSVLHGQIREVSLVLAGANPGALIDNLNIEHADGSQETDNSEAIIYTGEPISLDTKEIIHASEKTVGDIFETLNEEQKQVVYAMLASALESKQKDVDHSTEEGGTFMKKNIFEKETGDEQQKTTLSHSDIQEIFATAQKCGSLKEAFLSHLGDPPEGAGIDYGITDIEFLFPDAKTVTPTPTFISREMGWVQGVINGTRHSPFSRIKSMAADITADEARALGYVKGNLKKEEVIKLLKRVTTPTTIYKKQKLDRDDIVDITDMDVVAWLKAEMRVMLDEELARAVLIGDGRDPASEDKINEEHIRPIYTDDDMYAHRITLTIDTTIAATPTTQVVEAIIRARKNYKGSGTPALYVNTDVLTEMLLSKDKLGRRLYNTEAELASALRVSKIVEVPVMDGVTRDDDTDPADVITYGLVGIMVNLKDYVMGADKGGQISLFDDFDIDYNQYKYLLETRCSGALIHPKSAMVIEVSGEVVDPEPPIEEPPVG